MSWLDIAIVLAMAWFAFTGLSSGILRESVTLIGAVAGVILAGLLYRQLADDVAIFTTDERLANIVAFAAIFLAVFLAGQIAAVLLKRAASLLMLGPIDQILGLFFGIVKGFVVIEVLLILFTNYRVDWITPAINGSLLAPFFLKNLPILLSILPAEFRAAVERFPQ